MDLLVAYNTLNFYINKYTGSYYSPGELDDMVDAGQLAYFNDIKPLYARSQDIKDTLSPFKKKYPFLPINTVSGYIVVPSNVNYLSLLDVEIQFQISNRTVYYPVSMVNEDERSDRLNSQINPATITSPVGEMDVPRYIKLYPTAGYTGTVTYFKRPAKPFFSYTIISGRVINYNAAASTQLEWRDSDISMVLIKSLRSIGINMSAEDVSNFAQMSSQQNAQNFNHQ